MKKTFLIGLLAGTVAMANSKDASAQVTKLPDAKQNVMLVVLHPGQIASVTYYFNPHPASQTAPDPLSGSVGEPEMKYDVIEYYPLDNKKVLMGKDVTLGKLEDHYYPVEIGAQKSVKMTESKDPQFIEAVAAFTKEAVAIATEDNKYTKNDREYYAPQVFERNIKKGAKADEAVKTISRLMALGKK